MSERRRRWWDDGGWPFVLQYVVIALASGLAIGLCNYLGGQR